MDIPNGWTTERAPGRLNIHHLIHATCGFRCFLPEDQGDVTRLIASHTCEGRDDCTTASGTYTLRIDGMDFEQAMELLRKLRAEGYKAEYV